MTTTIISELSKPLPSTAIQRTRKDETRKGYDTDGYGYQWVADRLNEVLGLGWDMTWEIVHHAEGTYRSGAPYHDVTVRCMIKIRETAAHVVVRECAGGHIASLYGDALKGAITNAFKKTAAFFGVGRDAYAGTIDDDNQPLPDDQKNRKPADLAGEIATRITDGELKDALRTMVSDKRWSIPECHSFCQTREWDNAKIMTDLLAYKQNMVADLFSGEAV
jgi:hypothetical protein